MKLELCASKQALGEKAAKEGAALIRDALRLRGEASVIIASGASQLEMLGNLVTAGDLAWHDVTGFHLDEYVGLPITHPASFRLYMWQRFVSRLPLPLRAGAVSRQGEEFRWPRYGNNTDFGRSRWTLRHYV